MNKKIWSIIFSILICTMHFGSFSSNKDQSTTPSFPSFALSIGIIYSALYLGSKAVSQYQQARLPDAPPHVQQWIRKILAEKGLKDANTIALKLEDRWTAYSSFICINAADAYNLENIFTGQSKHTLLEQKIILADAEYSLLHEKKHYDNGDIGKGLFIQGISTLLVKSLLEYTNSSPSITWFSVVATPPIASLLTTRHMEYEADRYAFMNVSSLENLAINKMYYEVKASQIERLNRNNVVIPPYNNCLDSVTIDEISKRLRKRKITFEAEENDKKSNEKHPTKRARFEIVSFLSNRAHPSFLTRAELAEECLNKRKKYEFK